MNKVRTFYLLFGLLLVVACFVSGFLSGFLSSACWSSRRSRTWAGNEAARGDGPGEREKTVADARRATAAGSFTDSETRGLTFG